jgi:hypothetical protein
MSQRSLLTVGPRSRTITMYPREAECMLMKKHRIRVLIAVGLLAFTPALSLGQVQAAQASQPNDSWSTNQKVGYCGATLGGYVLAAQNFLNLAEGYTPMDAQFGTNSYNATRAFQSWASLGVDGCIGPQTWSTMRSLTASLCPSGNYSCTTPNFQTIFGNLFERTNCDWGTYIGGAPVGGGVNPWGIYSFAAPLTGVVSCA